MISDNNHGLDKELVRLAEKHAREREEREKRERQEREVREAVKVRSSPPPPPTPKQIQVKPIIETQSTPITTESNAKSRKSYVKMSNGDADMNKNDDLLRFVFSNHSFVPMCKYSRFTPPPDHPPSAGSYTTNPNPSTSELPAKLQQMAGPSGPIKRSNKAKW